MNTILPPSGSTQSESNLPQAPIRRVRKRSMTWTLSLYMIGVVVIALVLTVAVVDWLLRDSLARDQQNLLAERIAQQVVQVRDFRDGQLMLLRQVASNEQFPVDADRLTTHVYLEQALVLSAARFSSLTLISNQGEILAATADPILELDFAAMPWFKDAQAGFTGISHLQLLFSGSETAFFFYTPLGGKSTQQPEKILVGLLPASEIWVYVDPVKFNKSGYAYMADDHAVLIAHGARDADTGKPTHDLIFYAIGDLDDTLIRTANAISLYGEKEITVSAQIPSLADFIINLPPAEAGSLDAHTHRYYFPQQKANKTSVLMPVGLPAGLDVPVSVAANDWVLGITINDIDFLGPLTRLRKALVAVAGLSVLLSALIGVLASISVTRPSRQLANLAEQVQAGDYSARSSIRSGDEIGQLAAALNAMLNRLSQSMQVQQDQIHTLHRTGDEISTGALSLSSSAEQMASATEQLHTSAEQVVQAVQSMAHDAGIQMNHVQETAQQIHGLDQEIGRIAVLSHDLNRSSGQMQELATQSEQAIQQAHHLSQRVQTVLHLIEKFGRQTNMLALNATIEAARAGEMGASFVVVADEVRRLAESSEQALQEIDALNKAIQHSIDSIQSSIAQTGQAILVVAKMAAELSASAGRQAQTSTGLVEITNRLAAIAETNAASAEQIASSIEQQTFAFTEISSSSHGLAVLAQKLQELSHQLVGSQSTQIERLP